MRYDDYDASDAAADAFDDAREDAIRGELATLVDPIVEDVENLDYDRGEGEGIDDAHPWTHDRFLLWIYDEEGEDGLREYLVEQLREDAEAAAEDSYDSGPCCFQFSCPCGNSNNRPD